jgi:hypothetical protein
MRNDHRQGKSAEVLKLFLNEAKVKLVDAESAVERREWRTVIRSLEGLIRRKVRLPKPSLQQSNSRKRESCHSV